MVATPKAFRKLACMAFTRDKFSLLLISFLFTIIHLFFKLEPKKRNVFSFEERRVLSTQTTSHFFFLIFGLPEPNKKLAPATALKLKPSTVSNTLPGKVFTDNVKAWKYPFPKKSNFDSCNLF